MLSYRLRHLLSSVLLATIGTPSFVKRGLRRLVEQLWYQGPKPRIECNDIMLSFPQRHSKSSLLIHFIDHTLSTRWCSPQMPDQLLQPRWYPMLHLTGLAAKLVITALIHPCQERQRDVICQDRRASQT